MKILVLVKQTFDTEEKIRLQDGQVQEDGVRFVINPYDEYAIEEAIRIKEAGDAEVVVVSVGPSRSEEALRTALAMGADEAILADDSELFGDEYSAAKVLAAIARKDQYDLIIAGNQAVDDGSGQVAVRLAEELGIPHISTLTKLEVNGNEVIGHRDAEGDEEIVKATLPVLVTAQQGLNDPRYPSLIGIRKAGKKPLTHVTLADLGLTAEEIARKSEVVETFLPQPKTAGKILSGDLSQQVSELVTALHSVEKVIG
ncbi:electron transfer flavoprotein subunit beta/FixA family protein [Alicyclobacillus tolerans]|uniref:Electron transfer flavoprotein subunit beta n=1 Tax=Alicyclobacillus tolerans TaxID=90970 RepID=A0A1M6L564_9BACL|nr:MULTISPECIES: electron transfer flavoprotein subunit beta/FixA family protein [Alicyclobacillus]QRF24002.1 electron transfer flavoprotein subunit beta/FixA family protein [Alicyclobacillus sp. TC]SHJ66355.1 electron transfer flavoprotein beta subunit [Alicyclobacillus montanus]